MHSAPAVEAAEATQQCPSSSAVRRGSQGNIPSRSTVQTTCRYLQLERDSKLSR
jgi:hypothetical protein